MNLIIIILSLFHIFSLVFCIPAISIVASVKGKRYNVEGETVDDICKAIQSSTGLSSSEQSVLFRGKVLSHTDRLEDVGVAPGDTLNIVKGRKQINNLDIEDGNEDGTSEISIESPNLFDVDNGSKSPFGEMNAESIKSAMNQMEAMLDNNFIGTIQLYIYME